jgi:hypothetical protein
MPAHKVGMQWKFKISEIAEWVHSSEASARTSKESMNEGRRSRDGSIRFLNTAVNPSDVRVSLTYTSMDMRDEFQKWIADDNDRKYSPEVVLSCMDKISEYAVRKKIVTGSLWEYAQPNAFSPVYSRLLEAKLLRITDRKTHKVFITAGQLYLRFLKEKSFARKETTAAVAEGKEEKSAIKRIQTTINAIDPEDVIAWLVTQPNANGTLYLENVVRQYMGALRTAPAKLDIPVVVDIRSVFTCRTPDALNAYWEIFKATPNYKKVNSSTSGMFSAALNCYMRYLQHLANSVQADEPGSSQVKQLEPEKTVVVSIPQPSHEIRRVDFDSPEQCAKTRPINCFMNGQAVVPSKLNWSQLLVSITERFIADCNQNLESLNRNPLYGSKVFFLTQKAEFGTSAKLSNGKWIYTNYNPQTIVMLIRNLCRHCGVDLNDVTITYEPKDGMPIRMVQTYSRTENVAPAVQPTPKLDPAVIERLIDVLSAHFSNGYRLNSPIEMARFRSFAAEDLGCELTLSDEELKVYIAACGTNFDGKIYVVSTETKERIKELVENYFADGAQAIFFAEFYAKNENWLFGANVVSEDMLVGILRRLFPKLSFTQTYFGYTNASAFAALESEILRVWDSDVLLTYDQLTERLPYIPLERIKYALGQNGDFIWNSVETFSHISRIEITEEERKAIRAAAVRECNAHGYVSITDLPFGEIEERNYELSVTGVHNAVYRICLSDKFGKKGKIVTRKGDVFDALTIMKEYCRTVDKCSLDDLLNYEKELTGEVHRWVPMEAGNTVLVRIDKETYVADRYVHFDVDLVDEAIELVVKGDYLPLKSFITFGAFPVCGQTWNLFLLESYCRRFSRKFRFDTPSVNSRNAGTVIRKSCVMNYTEIMTDAVANAEVPLNDAAVGRFLFDSGYTGRSTTAKVTEIIDKAKAIRERRD